MGIFRKTFVIDPKGLVIKEFDKVTPEGHSAEVLSFLKGIKNTKKPKKVLAKATSKAKK